MEKVQEALEMETARKKDTTLRIWLSEDLPNLDPQHVIANDFWRLFIVCYEGLVRQKEPGKVEMGRGLAEKWSVSSDERVYTFHLKKGLKWSDDEPLLAEHFVHSVRRALDPRNGLRPWQMYVLQGARRVNQLPPEAASEIDRALNEVGVEAEGDLVVKFTLEQPAPYFPSLLALPLFTPVRPDRPPAFWHEDLDRNVYSGPFQIKRYVRDERIELEKNHHYYDADAIPYSNIVFRIGGDPISLYRNGEVDFLDVDEDQLPDVPLDHLHYVQEAATLYLVCHTRDPLLSNVHLRRAISLAIDREEIATEARHGSTAADGLIPPAIQGGDYRAAAGEMFSKAGDVDAALKALHAAREELGEIPPLKILCGHEPASLNEAEAVARRLQKKLGIRVEIEGEGITERFTRVKDGQYQLAMLAWRADYDDPLSFLAEHVSDGAAGNQSKWSHPEYNRLIREARGLTGKERQQKSIQAERLLLDEAVIIPICYRGRAWVVRPGINGLAHLPTGPSPELRWVTFSSE